MGSTFFAAVGDVHGEVRAMEWLVYDALRKHPVALSFVLQVGDFEPHRNATDLATMAAPAKYRKLGDFPKFASGELSLSWPVYFIGGNHEPYGYLDQHVNGAEISPGFTYLGRAGEIEIGSLRVAGLSGIHCPDRFDSKRPGVAEFATRSNKDYIGFNDNDFLRALDFDSPDILLLHDWPSGIVSDDDLCRWRRRGMKMDRLRSVGNTVARELVDELRAPLVICGHMHFEHRAIVRHTNGSESAVVCLAKVGHNLDAVAIFEQTENGEIVELS